MGFGNRRDGSLRNTVLLIAFAGLATSAVAQDFSLSIWGPTELSEGAVFTIDIIADASVGTHMLGGGFSLVTTFGESLIENIVWTPAHWSAFNTDNGFDGNGSHQGVIFGQIVIPDLPPFNVPATGSELGQSIGSFQITLGNFNGVSAFRMELVAADPFSLEVIDSVSGETFQSADGNLQLGSFTIVFPAPSSLALLGFGGLAVGRRRR